MINNIYRRQLALKNIKDLIDEGLKKMSDPSFNNLDFDIWLKYSQKVLDLTTKDYNPSILLNYLRLVLSLDSHQPIYKKMGICLEYLIGVLEII